MQRSCLHCSKPIKAGRFCCGSGCSMQHYRATLALWRASLSPLRLHAIEAIRKARRDGNLVSQPCQVCGKQKVVAHHDDYAAPLDVRWLCHSHHRIHHHKFGPGKNAFLPTSENA